MKRNQSTRLIQWLGLFVIALMLFGCEQQRVDAQMEELCKKDGGMKIYEKVVLPKERFTQYGDPIFFKTWDVSGTTGGGYRVLTKFERLRANKPTLTRYSLMVVRELDNKVLGTYVYYSRIGGDVMPRLGPDSAKNCPVDASEVIFIRAIFVQENQGK